MSPDTTLDHRKAAKAQRTRESLKHFDDLPNSAHVRLPVLCALKACGPATVWRHVRLNLLPRPVHLGPKISGWNVGELREHLAAQRASDT